MNAVSTGEGICWWALDVDGRQENGSIEIDFWFRHGMDNRAIHGDREHRREASLGGETGR